MLLLRATTVEVPARFDVQHGSLDAVGSSDVSRLFPTCEKFLIEDKEYSVQEYDQSTFTLRLGACAACAYETHSQDRPYEGPSKRKVRAFLSGDARDSHPPFIAVRQMLVDGPGNKFESSKPQEQVQNVARMDRNVQEVMTGYQFLDPMSEYEIAMKLGPISSMPEARRIAAAWKSRVMESFRDRKYGHCDKL